MDIQSCEECGIVVNGKKVKKIHYLLPDNPTETERDSDDYLLTEEVHYNPDLIWDSSDGHPLDTWSCPVCKAFNGIKKEE